MPRIVTPVTLNVTPVTSNVTPVTSNVTPVTQNITPVRPVVEINEPEPIASTSGLNISLQSRLGPKVTPWVSLSARLGPPNAVRALVQSTVKDEEVVIVDDVEACAEPKAKRPRGPDRRPEKYKALTQQGLEALNLLALEKFEMRRPFQFVEQFNRNDILWRELTHKDRTAREFSEWHTHLQTPRKMPIICYQTAKNMIAVTYKVVENHKLAVYKFLKGRKVKDTDARVIAFDQEVRECGFMSFDTEGGGTLPSKEKKKRENRVFVAMSSPKDRTRVLVPLCV
jgi:hypothetical protein